MTGLQENPTALILSDVFMTHQRMLLMCVCCGETTVFCTEDYCKTSRYFAPCSDGVSYGVGVLCFMNVDNSVEVSISS